LNIIKKNTISWGQYFEIPPIS